jgi:dGTPase
VLGTRYSDRIGILVRDVIEQSIDKPFVRISDKYLAAMNGLKEWMFDNVYLRYPVLYPDVTKAEMLVQDLFVYFLKPGALPLGYEGVQGAVDYVAGMTDRFAVETYQKLHIPMAWE